MDINSSDDLTDVVKIQLGSLSSLITTDGYELVCDQTTQELGWDYPLSTSVKMFWATKRATRHSFFILLIASANKFKYKQANLQQRFEHFKTLIDLMDKEFAEAIATDPVLFAEIGSVDENSFRLFGTQIDSGFSYNTYGEDTTYDITKYVNFSPLEDA